jgi:hypothetical protein
MEGETREYEGGRREESEGRKVGGEVEEKQT